MNGLRRQWAPGSTSRPTRRSPTLAWVLIAAFLLQPLLAYLATPVLGHGSDGRRVVVCTLKGQRLAEEDRLRRDGAPDRPATDLCPAQQLYQLGGTTPIPASAPTIAVVRRATAAPPAAAFVAYCTPTWTAYASRGPPFLA